MVVAKLQYHAPRLKVFGNTHEALASDARPEILEAVRALADDERAMRQRRDGAPG